MIKQLIKKAIQLTGYEIRKPDPLVNSEGIPLDIHDPDFIRIYKECKEFSTCSVEPMFSLYKSVEYIVKNEIEGDLVECGVYKGGSAMMMALSLLHFGCKRNRKIYLYDTFEGMPEPTDIDRNLLGIKAMKLLEKGNKETNTIWCYSPLGEVQNNLKSTGYDTNNLVFIKGMVEETIPETIPEKICILRLDTDWYSSTRHELLHLFPLLVKKGVIIIDDYGHWQGARKAADEFFLSLPEKMLLHRLDYTVRIGIKYE